MEIFPLPIRRTETPLLLPWGPLAELVARLVKHEPGLAFRLLLLPANGLHATAIALHAATEAKESDDSIAARLAGAHPRDLLREVFPSAVTELYRLLDRASIPAWGRDSYWELERLLRSRVSIFLSQASAISPERIETATALLDADPIVWRARTAFRFSHEKKHLSTVVELLRSLGLLRDLAEIPDGAGRPSVMRRVRADLARGCAADQLFPTVTGWSKIETVGALWEIGARLRLCARPGRYGSANFALDFITGKSVFLHHVENDLLAEVHHVVHKVWTVGQIAGLKNSNPPTEICTAFSHGLMAGGLVLVPSSPADALHNILQREERVGDLGIFDADDDDDDEPDEIDEVMASAFRIGLAGGTQV